MTDTETRPEYDPREHIAISSGSFARDFADRRRQFNASNFLNLVRRRTPLRAVEFQYGDLPKPKGKLHPKPQQLEFLHESVVKMDMQVVCVSVHNDFVRISPEDDVRYVRSAISSAEHLGARLLKINTGLSSWSASAIPMFLERFGSVVDFAKRARVVLVLENHGGVSQDPYCMLDIMLRAEKLYSGTLRMCLDIGNYSPRDCVEAIKLLARITSGKLGASPSRVKQRYADEALARLAASRGITVKTVQRKLGPQRKPTDHQFIGHVHAKCYSEDIEKPLYRGLEIDYNRIVYQLFLARYKGFFTIHQEHVAGQQGGRQDGGSWILPPAKRQERTISSIANMADLICKQYEKYEVDLKGKGEGG